MPNAKTWSIVIGVGIVVLSVIVIISVSIKKLASTEYGLQYHVWSKHLSPTTKTGGLHFGSPGYEMIKFPSTFITTNIEDTCVSKDGLLVEFEVTFQFQMPPDWLYPAVIQYRNLDRWKQVVKAAANSAIHHACSKFIISEFQNKRGIIQSTMEEYLRLKLQGDAIATTTITKTKTTTQQQQQSSSSSSSQATLVPTETEQGVLRGTNAETTTTTTTTTSTTATTRQSSSSSTEQEQSLFSTNNNNNNNNDDTNNINNDGSNNGVYALAISLQLRNVELPSEYSSAVADKQSAAEDIELAINQRTQEMTRARTNLLSAKEEAKRILNTARNDANITLTEAMLKAEEITFAFETEANVLADVKTNLNLTSEGLLAYMSNQLYASAPNLQVSAAQPQITVPATTSDQEL